MSQLLILLGLEPSEGILELGTLLRVLLHTAMLCFLVVSFVFPQAKGAEPPVPPIICPQCFRITASSGDGQTGLISAVLPSPLVVTASSTADGSPLPNFAVILTADGGAVLSNGSIAQSSILVVTGPDGTASATLTLGGAPGQYQVTAACTFTPDCTGSATFTENATCNLSLSPQAQSFGPNGGSASVVVHVTPAGCPWGVLSFGGVIFSANVSGPSTGDQTLTYIVKINRSAATTTDQVIFQIRGTTQQAILTITRQPNPETFAAIDPIAVLNSGYDLGVPAVQNYLVVSGREVRAVGADGATRVILRVPADFAGEQVSLSVLREDKTSSNHVEEDGGLAVIGDSQFASRITVTAVPTDAGPTALAVYQAPIDFPRLPAGTDDGKSSRPIFISSLACECDAEQLAIQILRPPVVLIHGMWGYPSPWKQFSPLVGNPKPIFFVETARFDELIGGQIVSSVPPYSSKILQKARANSLGVSFNAPSVLTQIGLYLAWFRAGQNPASLPAAAVQADIVTHSMGGLVARDLPFVNNFYTTGNFQQGSIHKLITIGTPHLGTPIAKRLLEDTSTCVREHLAKANPASISFVTVQLSGATVSGAVADLEGDGFGGGMSPIISQINTPPASGSAQLPLRIAPIAGHIDSVDPPFLGFLTDFACHGDLLAMQLDSATWPTDIFNQPSDGLVPLQSQLAGVSGSVFAPFIHSDSLSPLGLVGLSELTGNADIAFRVLNLLNTPISSSDFVSLPQSQ